MPHSLQLLNFSILGLGLFYLLAGDLDPRISFAVAILQLFTVTVRVFSYYKSITRQVQFGNGVNFKLFRQDMILPYALSDPFLVINLGASILCFTMFAYTWRADPFGWKLALMPGKYSGAGHNEGLLETWADVAAFTCGML